KKNQSSTVATLPAMAAAAAQRLLASSTKIVGAGRNYISHAKDLGNPVLKEPVLFLKPTSSFLHAGPTAGPIEVPEPLESLHHEVELAVVISRRARDVPEASAMDFVGGYALALDMSSNDLQSASKSLQVFLGLWVKYRTPLLQLVRWFRNLQSLIPMT
uniref:Fumarylacetoacetase-like C-terminal domain-containing protein n=1 Tax=Aegilops tauschii subsp. strangulata TaxID=200361 RepID=A0A453HE40_AEGTS